MRISSSLVFYDVLCFVDNLYLLKAGCDDTYGRAFRMERGNSRKAGLRHFFFKNFAGRFFQKTMKKNTRPKHLVT